MQRAFFINLLLNKMFFEKKDRFFVRNKMNIWNKLFMYLFSFSQDKFLECIWISSSAKFQCFSWELEGLFFSVSLSIYMIRLTTVYDLSMLNIPVYTFVSFARLTVVFYDCTEPNDLKVQ
jgi:hypothetical protein